MLADGFGGFAGRCRDFVPSVSRAALLEQRARRASVRLALVQQLACRDDLTGRPLAAGERIIFHRGPFHAADVATRGSLLLRVMDQSIAAHRRQELEQLGGRLEIVLPSAVRTKKSANTDWQMSIESICRRNAGCVSRTRMIRCNWSA